MSQQQSQQNFYAHIQSCDMCFMRRGIVPVFCKYTRTPIPDGYGRFHGPEDKRIPPGCKLREGPLTLGLNPLEQPK